ncbi:hypothetical protein ABIA94_005379 [Bradyrhizobium sp. LA7.1]
MARLQSRTGFSIGFDADWLLQNAAAQGFDITPVIHDTEQQAERLSPCSSHFFWKAPASRKASAPRSNNAGRMR